MKKNLIITLVSFLLVLPYKEILSSNYDYSSFDNKAKIEFDDKGLWFIKGKTLYHAFKAMGYCVAKDRLWQAEIYRRTGKGTLSEILGPSQLETDIYVRTLGYSREELQEGFESLNNRSREIIQAYVDGFNLRIAEVREDYSLLPFEFKALGGFIPEDWQVTDVLALTVFLARNFDGEALSTGQIDNTALFQELAIKYPNDYFQMFSDLRPINDPTAQTMIPEEKSNKGFVELHNKTNYPENFHFTAEKIKEHKENIIEKIKKINAYLKMGSYAWVVSGKKTVSGNPILYSGPQMGFFTPSIVCEGSIDAPGYKVSGMTVTGCPIILVGRTPAHAWSMQTGHAHTVDYYLEDTFSVELHRIETIKIAGENDVVIPIYRTSHGPVINPMPYNPAETGEPIISWKYSQWKYDLKLVEAFFDIGTADNLQKFGKAIEKLPITQHFCYADKNGNIAYWMSGRDPIRPKGVDSRLLQLGNGSQEWPEPVTLKPRSHASNPEQGYFGGWNNKSNRNYDNNNSLEYHLYGPFHRAHVIQDYLSSKESFTYDDLRGLALNIAATESLGRGGNTWKFVMEYFTKAINNNPTPERLEALQLLNNWDGHFIEGGESEWISGNLRADAWVLQNEWILKVLELTFNDELQTFTLNWKDQPPSILFNVLIHGLKGDSQYNWFQDVYNSGKPTTSEGLIILALDNVLNQLGPRPWNVPRGEIVYNHDMLGPLGSTPYSQRSTYAQCVEIGQHGPVKIESMFPLGQSGAIFMDSYGSPVFDENFFSMKPLFDSFNYKVFPLFKNE